MHAWTDEFEFSNFIQNFETRVETAISRECGGGMEKWRRSPWEMGLLHQEEVGRRRRPRVNKQRTRVNG